MKLPLNILLTLLAAAVTNPAAELRDAQPIVTAERNFAWKLVKETALSHPGANVLLSPYSAWMVLGMLSNGLNEHDQAALALALGAPDIKPAALNVVNRSYRQAILTPWEKAGWITTASALWYCREVQLEPGLVSLFRTNYGTTAIALDFSSPGSLATINDWVDLATHRRIQNLVRNLPANDPQALVLAHVIWFKDKWKRQFNPSVTREESFNLANGQRTQVHMMGQEGKFWYTGRDKYEAMILPYAGTRLQMRIVLPRPDRPLGEFVSGMTAQDWEEIVGGQVGDSADRPSGYKYLDGHVKMPRFVLSGQTELTNCFAKLGMQVLAKSLWFRLGSPLPRAPMEIASIIQACYVQTDEEGSEAAAASVLGTRSASTLPLDSFFVMTVDRPFIFLIEDGRLGKVILAGILFNP